jgi:hypothetical protein
VLAVLRAPAGKLRSTPDEALDLALTVAAAAHGLSVFLLEDVLGTPPAALAATRDRAAAIARALARTEPTERSSRAKRSRG